MGKLISNVTKFNQPHNRNDALEPFYDFWSVYKNSQKSGYYYKNISPEPEDPMESVAGISGVIPWKMLKLDKIERLKDIAQLTKVGIALPINAFEIGIEEFELEIVGDTFQFIISLSDEGILPGLHEICHIQHSMFSDPEHFIPTDTEFSGINLLVRFYEQFLQIQSVTPCPERKKMTMGLIGPDGHELYFYPTSLKGS